MFIGQDPEYYQRMSERMGLALRSIAESRARREEREAIEIQRHMALMAEMPDLADTMGEDLIRKYGRKRPELVSLVSTLQNQNELNRESQKQLNHFSNAFAKNVGERQRFYEMVESMDDEMTMPMGPMGPTVTVPNVAKQAARSQIATMAPPEWDTFSKLSDEERFAVMVAMKREGIKIPEAPDTVGPNDLSQALRGLHASGYDFMSPEFQSAALGEAGEKETPAAVAKRTEDVKVEEAKNERELREKKEAEDRAAAEFDRRRGVTEAGQIRLMDERDRRKPPKKTPEDKEAAKQAEQQIASVLNVRLKGSKERKAAQPAKDARAEVSPNFGKDFEDVTTKGTTALPPPEPVRVVHELHNLALDAAKAGASAEEAAANLLKDYDLLRAKGIGAGEALQILRSKLEKALTK